MTDSTTYREKYVSDALQVLAEANELLFELSRQKLKGRDEELRIPLISCCNTAVAIHKLLYKDIHTELEAYMLMRALFERIVNFHYLRVADGEEVEKYFMHAWYRMYHMTNRQEIGLKGTIVLKANSDYRKKLRSDPTIKKALDLFDATKPGLNWTDLSFAKRIRYIGKKGAIREDILLLASIITYSDASEILHGTFYGEVFLTGAFTPGAYSNAGKPSSAQVNRHISSMLRLPLVVLAELLIATVQAISKDYSLKEFINRANALEKRVEPILKDAGKIAREQDGSI